MTVQLEWQCMETLRWAISVLSQHFIRISAKHSHCLPHYFHPTHRQKQPKIMPNCTYIVPVYMTSAVDTVLTYSPERPVRFSWLVLQMLSIQCCLYAVRSCTRQCDGSECSCVQPDPTNYVNICKQTKVRDLSFPFLFQTSYIIPICLVWYVQGVCKFLPTTELE